MLKTTAFCLSLMMLFPGIATGEETAGTAPISPDDPGIISPLAKNRPAPFPGILFSPRAAASVATDISTFNDKLKIEVENAVGKCEAKAKFDLSELKTTCDADKERLSAKLDAALKRADELQTTVDVLQKNMPKRSTWFILGATTGVVLSGLLVFGTVQLVK